RRRDAAGRAATSNRAGSRRSARSDLRRRARPRARPPAQTARASERRAPSRAPCSRRRRSRRPPRRGPRAASAARPPGLRPATKAGLDKSRGAARSLAPRRAGRLLDLRPRLFEHIGEDPHQLVELRLTRDERRRDLDDWIAAVVGAADQAALEQLRRKEAAQQPLRLLVREGLARLLVLHELERVEAARTAEVARDRKLEEPLQRRAVHRLL